MDWIPVGAGKRKFEEHAAATSRPSSVLGEAAKYSRFTLNKERHSEPHVEQWRPFIT